MTIEARGSERCAAASWSREMLLRACVVLAFVVLGPAVASAKEAPRLSPAPSPAAKAPMEGYFAGEKLGGYIFAGLGVVGLTSHQTPAALECRPR
jgi:hypothetical protein